MTLHRFNAVGVAGPETQTLRFDHLVSDSRMTTEERRALEQVALSPRLEVSGRSCWCGHGFGRTLSEEIKIKGVDANMVILPHFVVLFESLALVDVRDNFYAENTVCCGRLAPRLT